MTIEEAIEQVVASKALKGRSYDQEYTTTEDRQYLIGRYHANRHVQRCPELREAIALMEATNANSNRD